MGRNDYHVIACKLLKYLYDCLRKGKEINFDFLTPEYFKVDGGYWDYVLRHLVEDGHIEGAILLPIMGTTEQGVKMTKSLNITPKGIEYLDENSAMKKAKDFLELAQGFIP